jgi:hypothetical protein
MHFILLLFSFYLGKIGHAADLKTKPSGSDIEIGTVPPVMIAAPSIDDSTSSTTVSSTSKIATTSVAFTDNVLWVGPGIAIYDGNYGGNIGANNAALSMNFGFLTNALDAVPLFVGLDGALHFWNSQVSNRPIAGTGLQILPTAIYKFTIISLPHLKPFFGLSFGPHAYIGQSAFGGNTTVVLLEFLIRPGMQWQLNPDFSLNFEPKIGFLGNAFISIPQFTLALAL